VVPHLSSFKKMAFNIWRLPVSKGNRLIIDICYG